MHPARLAAILAIAFLLTATSAAYQRVGPTRQVEGEGFCPDGGRCQIPVLAAGFPFPYLLDNPQVSVPHSVHLVEDDFRPLAFGADLLLYLGLIAAVSRILRPRAPPNLTFQDSGVGPTDGFRGDRYDG